MKPTILRSSEAPNPVRLLDRLSDRSPKTLTILGNFESLSRPKTALFCSVRCPGDRIIAAYDLARKLEDEEVAVISGFHSPVEKECLRNPLRGKQPIIICLARAIEIIRLPTDWRGLLEAGRLLLISPFEKRPRRPTVESAHQRNEIVAELADDALIIHAEPNGSVARIAESIGRWKIPERSIP